MDFPYEPLTVPFVFIWQHPEHVNEAVIRGIVDQGD